MSLGSCVCPPAAAITVIPVNTCGINIGQVQKLIIARRQANAIPDRATDAPLIATWNALIAALDGTKHQVTPFVEGVVIPPVTPILEGGDDNTTLDGNPIVVGTSSIRQESGTFRTLSTAVLTALQSYNCEDDLMIYLINQYGIIYGWTAPLAGGVGFTGIPIRSFFVGDPGSEGLNTHDKTPVSWSMRYGWRSRLIGVVPTDFDALTDLVPA